MATTFNPFARALRTRLSVWLQAHEPRSGFTARQGMLMRTQPTFAARISERSSAWTLTPRTSGCE
jgi:hypothetical protein